MTTDKTFKGIRVGAFLGSGAYSKVYTDPDHADRVLMFGKLSDDMFKLSIFESLGFLHGFESLPEPDRYCAALTRLGRKQDSETANEKICAMVSEADSIFFSGNYDGSDRWLEFGSNPKLSPETAIIINLFFKFGFHSNKCVHFDNHSGNWLIAPNGNVIPMDVINGGTTEFDQSDYDMLIKKFSTKPKLTTPEKPEKKESPVKNNLTWHKIADQVHEKRKAAQA